MAKLTKVQSDLIKKIERTRDIYFKRPIDSESKEQCFVGRNRVNNRVFFFLYDIGFLRTSHNWRGRKWEYYYMDKVQYKLEEYLEDFQKPYVIPE